MNTQWFLGANTALGFQSKFEALHHDRRIRRLIILKGGPGCGKSTFMKKLLATATHLGAPTESYPCASDPESLDGLLILPLGLAIVDGTEPHVLEPELCGCGESYLNLGCFYESKGLVTEREKLSTLLQAYRGHFPCIYAHLSAAGALGESIRQSMKKFDSEGLFQLISTLLGELSPSTQGQGYCREVFLRAYTPSGEVSHLDSVPCGRRIAVIDRYGLCHCLFARLKEQYIRAGYDCICALSPLIPDQLEGLIIPEADTAYVTCTEPPKNCAVTIHPEQFFMPSDEAEHLKAAIDDHLYKAMALMQSAKLLHDEMELLYRPFVSFEGISLLTQEYQKSIRADLLTAKS